MAPDRFGAILAMVNTYNSKLTAANELYDLLRDRMRSCIDSPQEALAFIGEHLILKEREKKMNGEVFTPPTFVLHMIDQLEKAYPTVFTDPSITFLDPANGHGNFPVILFHKLMVGLATAIPDSSARKKHILEKQLYMCEINGKNVEICKKLFDPHGVYKLNLFHGPFQDLNPETLWGIKMFNVVLGNPPYNKPATTKGGAGSRTQLFPFFVKRSLDLLKINGFLCMVHPPMWRAPQSDLRPLLLKNQVHFLQMYSEGEAKRIMNASTRIDMYVVQKKKPTTVTRTISEDMKETPLLLSPSTPFIMSKGQSIFEHMYAKILSKEMMPLAVVKNSIPKAKCKDTKQGAYIYPLIHSTGDPTKIAWSSKEHPNQTQMKVAYAEGRHIYPVYDTGAYGTTDNMQSIAVASEAEGRHVCRYLSSKLMKYIVCSTKWSSFRTQYEMFPFIPCPPILPSSFTDADLYKIFALTMEQVAMIESDQPGPGLAEFTFSTIQTEHT